ncbi:MAG: hypothetical protein AAF650_07010 [Pseudomonadota bacterium]
MEELALLPVLLVIAMGEWLVLLVADVVGWMMGLGWRHYSKKRAAAKAEKKKLKETFE